MGFNYLIATKSLPGDNLILRFQELPVLNWSTSEGWKAESTLEYLKSNLISLQILLIGSVLFQSRTYQVTTRQYHV